MDWEATAIKGYYIRRMKGHQPPQNKAGSTTQKLKLHQSKSQSVSIVDRGTFFSTPGMYGKQNAPLHVPQLNSDRTGLSETSVPNCGCHGGCGRNAIFKAWIPLIERLIDKRVVTPDVHKRVLQRTAIDTLINTAKTS